MSRSTAYRSRDGIPAKPVMGKAGAVPNTYVQARAPGITRPYKPEPDETADELSCLRAEVEQMRVEMQELEDRITARDHTIAELQAKLRGKRV